ncbi:MAG: hypothetical protein IJ274_14615 [Lachnospiraceae bacterium]|nr:hypothetical protein [Lachnospiraceae bacterium]
MANETYSEKVSVNINSSTLSNIDLLVDNGYYSNRSDFINHALRVALQQQQSTLDRIISKKEAESNEMSTWFLGLCGMSREEVERRYNIGQQTFITGYGILIIDEDCDEEKLFATMKEINVKGKVFCSDAVKKHYGLK